MTQKFKAGDKVRIIEGGWGIHPIHVGKIVTIHRVVMADKPRYELTEDLTDCAVHSVFRKKDSTARGESFELVQEALELVAELRQLNSQIEELQAQLAQVQARRRTVAAIVCSELKL